MKHDIKSGIKNAIIRTAFKANYALGNYKDVIWLLGDGRSGTTWVSDLINHDKKLREMFEPFHPKIVRDKISVIPHPYIRPYELSEETKRISSDIFSGKFTHKRVDSGNRSLIYNGILVKDIFANLLCYAVSIHFQKVKPVLLIRNPFSVALSKYKMKHWYWATEPLDFLNQNTLREDYLLPFEDIIRKTSAKNNYLLNQVLIWSIINYVPLRQFKPGTLHICFYEKIYAAPSQEISKILEFARGASDNSPNRVILSDEIINRPSRVIGTESSISAGTSPVLSWQSEISPQLLDEGLEILQCFGFHDLYDQGSMPNEIVLERIYGS